MCSPDGGEGVLPGGITRSLETNGGTPINTGGPEGSLSCSDIPATTKATPREPPTPPGFILNLCLVSTSTSSDEATQPDSGPSLKWNTEGVSALMEAVGPIKP